MFTQPKLTFTLDEYLEQERGTDVRSEYWNGNSFPVEASTFRHSRIVTNVAGYLNSQTGGYDCYVAVQGVRVYIPKTTRMVYPDVLAVCGPREYLDDYKDTLLNPTLVIEVLSPSTRNYDLGDKFRSYKTIPSLQTYVMIEQDEYEVVVRDKHSPSSWTDQEINGLEAVAKLASLHMEIPLRAIYARLE